jgi:hypothetical protein
VCSLPALQTDSTKSTCEAVPAAGDSNRVGQDWSFPVNVFNSRLTDSQDI